MQELHQSAQVMHYRCGRQRAALMVAGASAMAHGTASPLTSRLRSSHARACPGPAVDFEVGLPLGSRARGAGSGLSKLELGNDREGMSANARGVRTSCMP